MKIEEELQTTHFSSERHRAILNIMFTASQLRTVLNRELDSFGITQEQFNVLRILRGKHPNAMCVKDITSRMLDRSSNTTRIIDKLSLKGYVHRTASEKDRREVNVALSDKGLSFIGEVSKAVEKQNFPREAFSETEAQLLSAMLDKFRDTL